MMKKICSLFVFLVTTLGAMAQFNGSWVNPHTNQPAVTTIVHAKLDLKDGYGDPVPYPYEGYYTIAAFVGDECRLVTLDNAAGVYDGTKKLLTLAVPGNYDDEDDTGKPITFLVYINENNNADGEIYKLNASQTITFRDGNAYGLPTSPVVLSMKSFTSINSGWEIGVGESVNVRDLIAANIEPSDASIPQNALKLKSDFTDYATLEGDVLTGKKIIDFATLHLMHPDGSNTICELWFKVVQPATSIELLKTDLTVEKNDASTLSDFMKDAVSTYKLLPDGSSANVQWEFEDDSYITYSTTGDNPWNPVKEGTVKMRPYFMSGTTKIVPASNKWVTVDIVVPVTKAWLKWEADVIDFKCNVNDDIWGNLEGRMRIEPSDADQTFTVKLENESDSKYLKIDNANKSVVALERNKGLNIWIVPNGYNGEAHKFLVHVIIENQAKFLKYKESPLVLSSTMSPADAFKAIINNVYWTPEGSLPNGDIKFTSEGWMNARVYANAADEIVAEDGDLPLTMEETTHTVHVMMKYNIYHLYGGAGCSAIQLDMDFDVIIGTLTTATGIELLKTELTVDKDDASTLSGFMKDDGGTYKLTPDGSTAKVQWEIADAAYITYSDTGDNPWNPVKGGTVKMRPYFMSGTTKIVPANDKWVTVTINVPIEKAYLKWDADVIDVKCNVDDNIYTRLKNRIKIEPSDADQTYTIELENASDSKYLKIDLDNSSIKALAPTTGTINIRVVPNGYNGDEKKFLVPVSIENYTKQFTLRKSSYLTLYSKMAPADALTDIVEFVVCKPEGSKPYGGIQYKTDGWLDASMYINDAGETVISDGGTPLKLDPGTYTVYWQHNTISYDNYYGLESQIKVTPQLYTTFTAKVSNFDHFDIEWSPNQYKTTGKIKLTPVPSDATYDISDFTKTFSEPQAYTDLSWTGIERTNWMSSNNCELVTSLPGIYTFTVTRYGENYGTMDIDIPAHISYNFGGWKWCSIPYGDLAGNKVKNFFNSRVVEARTYDNLLINDPSWGFYGSLLNSGINKKQMYKVEVGNYANDFFFYLEDAASVDGKNVWKLQPGWNWMGSPYFYDRLFSNAIKSQSSLVAGMVIVSKRDGQKEYDGTAWKGDLDLLKAKEGYLVYNPTNAVKTITLPTETTMTQGNETSAGSRSFSRAGSVKVWQYDHSQFADNMTMVVKMPELQDAENYTIGAFVDGECRGEGSFDDGFGFVTVHCNTDELVSFQLHNEVTGEYYDIDQTVRAQTRVGSLGSPYKMTSGQNTFTGIGTVNSSAASSQLYDLNGHQLNSQRKGVNILRRTDGTVRKVVVK
jgi:hypothetical protein